MAFAVIIYLAFVVLCIAGLWKVFEKAGEPGWAAIIPIYNIYIITKIAGKEWWWLLLLFIPFVGFVVMIILYIAVAEKFGKSAGFAVGMVFLPFIFLMILGFGDAEYQEITA
jgi:hypothetical protein